VATDITRSGLNVYGVTIGDELICLDLQSGRLNWSFQKPYAENCWYWSSAPLIDDSGLYFGALNGSMYALDARSGKVIWSSDLGARITSSAALMGADLYVGTADHHFYRLNRNGGKIIDRLTLEGTPGGPLVRSADALLITLYPNDESRTDNAVACIDPLKMNLRWSQRSASGWSMREPVVMGNTVLAGNSVGELFAFRLSDGKPDWSDPFKGTIRSIGLDANNVLYIGTLGGTVYAYDPK
jgi:outer membrane protein assembly factor BamB